MSVHHLSVVECDDCGAKREPLAEMSGVARAAAIAAGWTHPAFARDRCPKCAEEAA